VLHEDGDDDVDENELRHQNEDDEVDGSNEPTDAAVANTVLRVIAVVSQGILPTNNRTRDTHKQWTKNNGEMQHTSHNNIAI